MRKNYSGKFKAKVVVDVIKEQDTVAELSSKYEIHRSLLTKWKREAIEGLPGILSTTKKKKENDDQKLIEVLYRKIGQLEVENDWLKKRLRQSVPDRRHLIDRGHPDISINKQCELLQVSKGALYYQPMPIDPYTLALMDMIDEQHTKTPFYGSRRLKAWLNLQGHKINRKRVQRLMRLMRIEAIYPKPKLSRRNEEHKVYPYLLKDVQIKRIDQVWSTDISYLKIGKGFAYLTAVIDWFSRYVLSWRLSNTLENTFCVDVLEEALTISKPEIFNTDQGCQYTAANFLKPLQDKHIQISMDSKGRALDNIFVERLWRTVKYEEVYLKDYQTMRDAQGSLKQYFKFYNKERLHQALQYKTPESIYLGQCVEN